MVEELCKQDPFSIPFLLKLCHKIKLSVRSKAEPRDTKCSSETGLFKSNNCALEKI